MDYNQAAFHELSFYTMSHQGGTFIHQYIVDAQGAQTAHETSKPIGVVFALVGLYLYIEKDFTGREVQLFHMKMAKRKVEWPSISLPEDRGDITVEDILAATSDAEKDQKIRQWCEAVWEAYAENRNTIVNLVEHYGV